MSKLTCFECGKVVSGKYTTKGLFGEVIYLCKSDSERYDRITEHNKRVRNRLVAEGWLR